MSVGYLQVVHTGCLCKMVLLELYSYIECLCCPNYKVSIQGVHTE